LEDRKIIVPPTRQEILESWGFDTSKADFRPGADDVVRKIRGVGGFHSQKQLPARELFQCSGSMCREVLPELWGKPLDNLSLAVVMSVQPSYIRLSTGEVTTDSVQNRVTIFVTRDYKTIEKIWQEAPVGGGCGHDVDTAYRERYGVGLHGIYSNKSESEKGTQC
jgi:hypothetical protein